MQRLGGFPDVGQSVTVEPIQGLGSEDEIGIGQDGGEGTFHVVNEEARQLSLLLLDLAKSRDVTEDDHGPDDVAM
ncbi:MAG: hypothetical protein ACLFWG_08895 [Longimicrobiales bacterium]